MGQSTSTFSSALITSSTDRHEPTVTDLSDAETMTDSDFDHVRDFTDTIPDECLAQVFHFLGAGDRKRCSVVCRRWLRVDGQSRHRLSLNAQAEIVSYVPALFSRFDSVTKLALRCDRKSVSITDEGLVLISVRCRGLTRFKLRGCRDVTDLGLAAFAMNCGKSLKKFSCGSCNFGASGIRAVLTHCLGLEELSVKRLRGVNEEEHELIELAVGASSLKSICLKELVNGKSFEPLVIGCKKLETLKIIRCFGDWDWVLERMDRKSCLIEVHLERIHFGDVGLIALSRCVNLEILHILKAPECSNLGLASVAENCRKLRKLHIDGWRTNRIGDEGLIVVGKNSVDLEELVLIGVHATHLSLAEIASNCKKLERLALCGSGTIGDREIECVAEKCVALKKLCVKGCGISDVAIEAIGWGCPNLVKLKVKKCKGVSTEVVDLFQEQRATLAINFEASEIEDMDASASDGGAQEVGEGSLVTDQVVVAQVGASTSNGRLALIREKLGIFSGRNLVACAFNRWSRTDDNSNSNS